MMALFIVLWLMGTSEHVKSRWPVISPTPSGHAKDTGSGAAGTGENLDVAKADMNSSRTNSKQL